CMADLPGAHPLRQQADDFRFALSKTADPATWLEQEQGLEPGEELEDKIQILIVGPNLSSMHSSDAFRQQFDGLDAAEDTSGATAKRIDDQIALGARSHHDCGCPLAKSVVSAAVRGNPSGGRHTGEH